MKAHQLKNNEKCFINICISDGIPAPEDISPEQLTEILGSETPSNYKIPMSITELRLTPDKSGNEAIVCDVAIHPQLFGKVEALVIFRDFLITIIFEALDTKYGIQINRDTWLILKNRKCMGTLVTHRVQYRDVQKVYASYQNPTKAQKTLINELKSDDAGGDGHRKKLITEIGTGASKSSSKIKEIQKSVMSSSLERSKDSVINNTRKPEYALFKGVCNVGKTASMFAEFLLPEVMKLDEITLDLGCDRIVLEARRAGYLFDSFFPVDVDIDSASAKFDELKHVS